MQDESGLRFSCFGFRVSEFESRVSGFRMLGGGLYDRDESGLQVSGFGFRGSDWESRVSGFMIRAANLRSGRIQTSGLGFQSSDFEIQDSGGGLCWVDSEFRVVNFGVRVSVLDFGWRAVRSGRIRASGLGFRISGLGFRVLGFGIQDSGSGLYIRDKSAHVVRESLEEGH